MSPAKTDRLPDWEARLVAALADAARRDFHPRDWNCARFAHSVAQQLTGRKLDYRWHGSLEASVDAVLPRVAPLQAQRGDVVMADLPEACLGVCLGACAVFVGARGLMPVPLRDLRAAWSV